MNITLDCCVSVTLEAKYGFVMLWQHKDVSVSITQITSNDLVLSVQEAHNKRMCCLIQAWSLKCHHQVLRSL